MAHNPPKKIKGKLVVFVLLLSVPVTIIIVNQGKHLVQKVLIANNMEFSFYTINQKGESHQGECQPISRNKAMLKKETWLANGVYQSVRIDHCVDGKPTLPEIKY